jgi:glycosyltransferase involved in cell wall biosynthesis
VSAGGAGAPDVTFIFPARNEEKTIGEVIEKARRAAERAGMRCEVIVADNSSDATPHIARSMGATVVDLSTRQRGVFKLRRPEQAA